MGTRMQPERVLTEYESSGYLSRKTLGEELSEVCRLRPGARAVVAMDATLTYEQLDRAITGYARSFLAKGLAKGDQVLLQLPNSSTPSPTSVDGTSLVSTASRWWSRWIPGLWESG